MPSFTTEESKELDRWLYSHLFGNARIGVWFEREGWAQIKVLTHETNVPAYSTSYEGMGAVLEAMRARPPAARLNFDRLVLEGLMAEEDYAGWFDISVLTPNIVALAAKAALESETGSPMDHGEGYPWIGVSTPVPAERSE